MPIKLEDVLIAIDLKQVRISDHADEEARADSLQIVEILKSLVNGEIIEQFTTDKPYPSCLILSYNSSNEPIHSVWAYNPTNQWSVLVTVYRPDPDRWIAWRKRRK